MISAAHPSPSFRSRTALAGMLALILAHFVRADSVKMPNGESLQGTIVQETADYVIFRSVSFGEIKIPRSPGMTLARTGAAAPATASTAPATASTAAAVSSAAASASGPPAGGAPGGPGAEAPSALKQFLGLSDRWSLEFEANLLVQNDKFHMVARGAEVTVGYRIPNESKPTQPRHEYGFFASHNYQKVNDTVVGENSEVAFRYFYQPLSRWLLVSQADWTRDRINGIDSRSHVLAIPSYRFIDTPRTRLLAGIGPSYMSDTRLIPISRTTTVKDTDAGFRAGFYELFLQTITPALKFRQTLVVLARTNHPSDTYNLRFDASLRRQLTPNLSLSLIYDYVRDESTVLSSESIATLKLMLGYHF